MDKRYYRKSRGLAGGFITFVLVTVLAVGAGYLCTKYVIYPYILGEEAPFSLGLGKGKETGSLPQGDSQDAAGSQDGSGAQDGQGAGGQDASGSQSGGDNTQQTQGPAGTGVVEGQQNITQTGTTPQTQGTESGGQQSGTAAGTDTTNSQGGSSPGANGIVLYTIQYGSFTTTEAAKEAVTSLETAGIGAITLSKDGVYKVVEEPYASEARARAVLPARKAAFGEDIFITTMEAWL